MSTLGGAAVFFSDIGEGGSPHSFSPLLITVFFVCCGDVATCASFEVGGGMFFVHCLGGRHVLCPLRKCHHVIHPLLEWGWGLPPSSSALGGVSILFDFCEGGVTTFFI